MKFDILNNKIKLQRENYVKANKVIDEIKIEPCGKYVACLDKLSSNYVLALVDGVETMQVANSNDIEFFEGYEMTPSYTDSVRRKLCQLLRDTYRNLLELYSYLNTFQHMDIANKDIVNDIKVDVNVISKIISNIYQHLTMTNDIPKIEINVDRKNDKKNIVDNINNLIFEILDNLNKISMGTIIGYIEKTIINIINALNNILNKLTK